MQAKAAKLTVEKVRRTGKLKKGEIMREAGYSQVVSLQPQKLFDTEGFKEELTKLGFDSTNARRVVAEILNKTTAQDKDRLKAADMIFEVHGDKAPEKRVIFNVTPIYGGQSTQSIPGHHSDEEDISTHQKD